MALNQIVVCPDCKSKINEIHIKDKLAALLCKKCRIIYPVKDDIPIILPKKARNYKLEHSLICNIKENLKPIKDKFLRQSIDNTLNLLKLSKNNKSWEWEDEEFWSKEYKKEQVNLKENHRNPRIWQREFLLKHLLNKTNLKGKKILSVGCGNGYNFRLLLSKYCDENTLYIATDISFEGLKLNRLRNKHKNSIYILSSADKLPFRQNSIDILCYFGILHHTERKTQTIPKDSQLLKRGGYILLHEAVYSHPAYSSILPKFLKLKIGKDSAHEERVNKTLLLKQINNDNKIKIIASREFYTIFLLSTSHFFSNLMTNNKRFSKFILSLDVLSRKLFGHIFPFFKGAEIMLLIRKSR